MGGEPGRAGEGIPPLRHRCESSMVAGRARTRRPSPPEFDLKHLQHKPFSFIPLLYGEGDGGSQQSTP